MFDGITPEVLASEALMTTVGFEGLVIIVEGPTDVALLRSLLSSDEYFVMHGRTKPVACGAIAHLAGADSIDPKKRDRIIACLDADYDRVLGRAPPRLCVLTDHHDIETTLLWSPALSRWLGECCSGEKVEVAGGVEGVRAKLLEAGRFLGAARFYAVRAELAIDFEGLNYDTYLDRRTLAINEFGLVQGLYNRNRDLFRQVRLDELLGAIRSISSGYQGDPLQLVNGHDLVALLGIMARNMLGSLSAAEASGDAIERQLRLAYRPEDWRRSEIGRAVDAHAVRILGRG